MLLFYFFYTQKQFNVSSPFIKSVTVSSELHMRVRHRKLLPLTLDIKVLVDDLNFRNVSFTHSETKLVAKPAAYFGLSVQLLHASITPQVLLRDW